MFLLMVDFLNFNSTMGKKEKKEKKKQEKENLIYYNTLLPEHAQKGVTLR